MDFENLFNDSISYTRETFAGHWDRWLILVLLGLPFSLVRFVLDPTKIFDKTGFHPETIPWAPLAALLVAVITAVKHEAMRLHNSRRADVLAVGGPK